MYKVFIFDGDEQCYIDDKWWDLEDLLNDRSASGWAVITIAHDQYGRITRVVMYHSEV